ncbi:TonB-dependent receptor [Quatrionicoccus australiensis]|nr:TonB-dependent receptor [Quatrionicoccus australiensis]
MPLRQKLICSYFLLACAGVAAEEAVQLSPVEVRAQTENLEGIATAGSAGVVSSQRLAAVPMLRPGEALEMVPGLIVTQHAGDGKANQYFLRGFNLDHGTDFATYVGGVPVNMPTHAHGQGYTDLNFLIPELVDRISFRKGPYYASEGDFSSAGAAHIDYRRRIDGTLAQLTLGQNGYARSLLASSPELAGGHLLYGLELFHNDGPWQVDEHYRKLNGVLSYSQGTRNNGFAITGMAYRGRWTSTDQIAQRAIDSGAVDRYGSLDSSTGGETQRYSLSGEWAKHWGKAQSRANVWWLQSNLDLWSNFQYCLNNGCPPGDQFKQSEHRQAGGFSASHAVFDNWAGFDVTNSFGLQTRVDRLSPVGLYATSNRETLSTIREDKVTQRSIGLWAQNETRWTDWFRSIQGLRADAYDFTVDASLRANSGRASDQMLTPKLSLVLGPWRKTELYFNYGHGFHSNDARGTTIRVDPADGVTPVSKVQPLVRTRGYEIGLRSEILPGWQSTVALWQLTAASELLFVGDAGTTEASRPSRRYGVEWTNLYVLSDWLALDADLAWSHARFRDHDPVVGDYIPGAVTGTANLGLTLDNLGPWYGALRLRYFGPRPLIEDNSVRSSASTLTNLRIGYKIDKRTQLALDVYNLFDRKVNDIEYWYCSRTAGEAANPAGCADGTAGGYDDRHIHPSEPRSFRLTVSHRF